ncbi:peptidase S24 [Aureispira]|nr:peptidase S24 [Aureispira sp.]
MNSVVTQRFINCHNKLKTDQRIRSSRQFALSLDYLPQSLSEILKNRRDVTIELLRKSIESYKLNPVYLFTGEGPLFMKEEGNKDFRVLTIVTDSQNDERIVHVPVPAQAGYASDLGNPVFVQTLPSYSLPDYKYKVGTHRSFDVAGDSMEPTLFEGDKVICSYLEPTLWESSVQKNCVYVVVTQADVLVKRIHNNIKDANSLKLISDNKYYEPFDIKLSKIKEIWYVRAKLSPFLSSPLNIKNILRDEVSDMKDSMLQQATIIENLYKTIEGLANFKDK